MYKYINFLGLLRAGNYIFPLITIYAGYSIANGSRQDQLIFLSIATFLLHSGVNVANDLEDYQIDALNGRSHVADIRRSSVFKWYVAGAIALAVAAFGFSSVLPPITGLILAVLAITSWMYNHRPILASRRPIMSIVVLNIAGAWLPFLLGASLGKWNHYVFWLLIFWGFGRMSLTLLKDYKDAPGDAKHGKRTFLLVFGGTTTARFSLGLSLVGWIGCLSVIAATKGLSLQIGALLIFIGVMIFRRRVLLRSTTYKQLHGVFMEASRLQIIFDMAIITCLIFS